MNRFFTACLGTVLLISFHLSSAQNIDQKTNYTEALASIEGAIESEMQRNPDPGLSISVFYKGQYILNKAYGHAEFDKKDVATSSTLFRNASTSKVLVALALLRLEEQGHVNLSAPLNRYLKQIDRSLAQLTLNQLLSHTAGLKDETDDFGPGGVTRHLDYVKGLDRDIKFTEAGEVFSYSNSGYNILGAVIETVTKRKFNEAMKALVFDFLDMPLSTYRLEEARKNHLAYGHAGSVGNFQVNHRIPDNALERASGLMFTTAKELNHLLVWLMAESTDQQEQKLKDRLMTVLAETDKTGSYWSYGYGLFHSAYCEQTSIWHSGGLPGYSATFLGVPDKDFSIVVLTNGENVNRWSIIRSTLRSLFNGNCAASQDSGKLMEFSNTEEARLIGTYTQGVGPVIEVFSEAGQLSMRLGSSTFRLKKNQIGQLVTVTNDGPGIAYTPKYDTDGNVKFLQYWVRAYPKIK